MRCHKFKSTPHPPLSRSPFSHRRRLKCCRFAHTNPPDKSKIETYLIIAVCRNNLCLHKHRLLPAGASPPDKSKFEIQNSTSVRYLYGIPCFATLNGKFCLPSKQRQFALQTHKTLLANTNVLNASHFEARNDKFKVRCAVILFVLCYTIIRVIPSYKCLLAFECGTHSRGIPQCSAQRLNFVFKF